ncbi:MAG: nucleotidyltransferase domain-containing protein, partial [Deltaproteobacteria bacterium]|nr:nucleotidyltransferase domain-containing protein [Deltaproteobacteria bacterium]
MHLLSFENCASILKQSSDLIAGYLFGSYAKNTQQNSSDIDLAFLFKRG